MFFGHGDPAIYSFLFSNTDKSPFSKRKIWFGDLISEYIWEWAALSRDIFQVQFYDSISVGQQEAKANKQQSQQHETEAGQQLPQQEAEEANDQQPQQQEAEARDQQPQQAEQEKQGGQKTRWGNPI